MMLYVTIHYHKERMKFLIGVVFVVFSGLAQAMFCSGILEQSREALDAETLYFRDVASLSLLGDEEQRKLLMQCYLGRKAEKILQEKETALSDRAKGKLEEIVRKGAQARIRMAEANQLLVASLVLKYRKRVARLHIESGDLLAWGNVGLLDAIDRWDPRKARDNKFSTYAYYWIRQAVQRFLYLKGGGTDRIYTPYSQRQLYFQWERAAHELRGTLNHPPSDEEISEATGIGLAKLSLIQDVERSVISHRYIGPGERDDADPIEMGKRDQPSPQDLATVNEVKERVHRALDLLGEREAHIIRLRFGIGPEGEPTEPLSLKEIGKVLGISGERVRQLEMNAMEQLRLLLMDSD